MIIAFVFVELVAQRLIVISAPSGCGKTTLAELLLAAVPALAFSVSACTRTPRPGEQDGKHYYFMDTKAFSKNIEENAFFEWEEVYEGQFYGTLHTELSRLAAADKHVLFDVDVRGGKRIKALAPTHTRSFFIRPPSLEVLGARLRSRATETEESLHKRLARAKEELKAADAFDVQIVNDNKARAAATLIEQVRAFITST